MIRKILFSLVLTGFYLAVSSAQADHGGVSGGGGGDQSPFVAFREDGYTLVCPKEGIEIPYRMVMDAKISITDTFGLQEFCKITKLRQGTP
jgi:hypothetical protein